MKKIIMFVSLMLLLASCGRDFLVVDSELENLYDSFLEDCEDNGIIPLQECSLVLTEDMENNIAGTAYYKDRLVVINKQRWIFKRNVGSFAKSVIYHELAHCMLGLVHVDVDNNLMNPYLGRDFYNTITEEQIMDIFVNYDDYEKYDFLWMYNN